MKLANKNENKIDFSNDYGIENVNGKDNVIKICGGNVSTYFFCHCIPQSR